MANTRSYQNLPTRIALPAALMASVVASIIVELIIAAIAPRMAQARIPDFQPLTFSGLIRPTVLGLLLTAVVAAGAGPAPRDVDPVAVMQPWFRS